jgi:hypothetical protein
MKNISKTISKLQEKNKKTIEKRKKEPKKIKLHFSDPNKLYYYW